MVFCRALLRRGATSSLGRRFENPRLRFRRLVRISEAYGCESAYWCGFQKPTAASPRAAADLTARRDPTIPENPTMTQGPVESPPPRPPETSTMAIISLVLSGLGIFSGCLPLGIVGVYLGYEALKEIRAAPGQITGDGLAKAGIILGWISIGLMVLGILLGCLWFALVAGFGALASG
jgi:hypothetical protein